MSNLSFPACFMVITFFSFFYTGPLHVTAVTAFAISTYFLLPVSREVPFCATTGCPSLFAQVIHVTGRIRCRPALVPGSARSVRRPIGLVSLAHTLPPSSLNEVRMESQMFVCRVNMDLQVTYCENRYRRVLLLFFCPCVGSLAAWILNTSKNEDEFIYYLSQDLRVYGSDPGRGGGTHVLPLHPCRRPGKPAA